MHVNIYISGDGLKQPVELLVTPFGPGQFIPPHLQDIPWRSFGTADTSDPLLGSAAVRVREDLTRDGFSLVRPTMR